MSEYYSYYSPMAILMLGLANIWGDMAVKWQSMSYGILRVTDGFYRAIRDTFKYCQY